VTAPTGWVDDGDMSLWRPAEPVETTYYSGRYRIDMQHGFRSCMECGSRVDIPEIHDKWHEEAA
jgi:hypothetical protein